MSNWSQVDFITFTLPETKNWVVKCLWFDFITQVQDLSYVKLRVTLIFDFITSDQGLIYLKQLS